VYGQQLYKVRNNTTTTTTTTTTKPTTSMQLLKCAYGNE
jgi:hypothetical protein